MNPEGDSFAPTRTCAGCTLCCKVLSITELQKPQNKWCPHCKVGTGCKIYDERPSECAEFNCGYLYGDMFGEHWYPARCKMVLVAELDGGRLAIHVDEGRPDAWRREPYYSEIKEHARQAAAALRQVVVCVQNRAIVILPDADVDLGPVGENERIIVAERNVNGRIVLEAFKADADDPRFQGAPVGEPIEWPAP